MSYILQGKTGPWEIVVGLEVHAQIISQAKLFSGSSTQYGADPNTHVSLVDAAFPGALPVINRECVAQGVRTGLGLRAQINKVSKFDRKNYFYADLPQGYQISQFYHPIVGKGVIKVKNEEDELRHIGVTRMHLEQDAGKLIHDLEPGASLLDLNRAGIGLMEIVSEPDIRSPHEAGAYLRKLRQILRYIGTCDGNMEEGSMRADVNVSVRHPGEEIRTRCEIKNVNSIRFVMQAVETEAQRQIEVWESGGTVEQETRLFDSINNETRLLRSKENAHDYRYFPDPDLTPIVLKQEWIDSIAKTLPELPDTRCERLQKDYGITHYEADILTTEKATADFYESVARGHDGVLASKWITGDLFAVLKKTGKTIENSPVSAKHLGEMIDLITNKTINGKIAKDVFETMVETGEDPTTIVDREGLRQVTDTKAISEAIESVLDANTDKLEQYYGGKDKLFGFFMGQVMKATKGKANPGLVNKTLKDILEKRRS